MQHKLLLILLLLLGTPFVLALGIAPAQIPVTYEGKDIPFTFTLRAESATSTFSVVVQGDLASSITLDRSTLGAGERTIHGVLHVVEPLAPGRHTQDIIVRESAGAAGGTINAQSEVAATLDVLMPYPEAYLEVNGNVAYDPGTALADITLTLHNLGAREVTPDRITLAVRDGDATIDSLAMTPVLVAPDSYVQLRTQYDGVRTGALTSGVHVVHADVAYAQTTAAIDLPATIGVAIPTLVSVVYADESGALKPIDIAGTVAWNRDTDAHIAIFLDNAKEPALQETIIVSPSFTHRFYLDTQRSGVPVHTVRAVITVGDASDSRSVTLAAPARETPTWIWMLVAGVVLLLLVLIVVILLWRHAMRT